MVLGVHVRHRFLALCFLFTWNVRQPTYAVILRTQCHWLQIFIHGSGNSKLIGVLNSQLVRPSRQINMAYPVK
jgi:hypothetical protein